MPKRKVKTKVKKLKVINVTPTYSVGQELIYSDERSMMEKTSIAQVKETGYLLSNGIMVNFDLIRIKDPGAYPGHCILADKEGLEKYQAYSAHQQALEILAKLEKRLSKMDKMNLTLEDAQVINLANKLLNKINTAINND